MDMFDWASEGLDWTSKNSGAIKDMGQLAMGGYNLYQGHKAGETAANFYDAAGETAAERWDMLKPVEQARIDEEMWAMPFQREVNETTFKNQGKQAELNGQILDGQSELLPGQIAREKELARFQGEMLPEEQDLYRSSLATSQKGLETTNLDIDTYEKFRPVEDKYYTEAMEGKDVGAEMDRAGGDVAHAYAGTEGQMRRDAARTGINPNSGRFTNALGRMNTQRAKDMGLARTSARVATEDTNFNRLGSALNARQRLAPANTTMNTQSLTAPNIRMGGTGPTGGTKTNLSGDPSQAYLNLGDRAGAGAQAANQSGWDLMIN